LIGFQAAAGAAPSLWPVLESLAKNLRRDYPDRLIALSTLLPPEKRRALEAIGCLVYSEPAEAVRGVAALAAFGESFSVAADAHAPTAIASTPLLPGGQSEPQALATLAAAGTRTTPLEVCRTAEAAVAAAARMPEPVVLTIVSPDITRKSDIGGVAPGLRDAQAVRRAFDTMLTSVQVQAPKARIDGVLVAPMCAGGVECILGAHYDPVFGPMVMFGLGGIFVEVLGYVALHSAPVSQQQALAMIRSTKGFGLLSGARGRTPVDLEFLAEHLSKLSKLAVEAGVTLQSIEINPFIALPRELGGGSAVDAVVVGKTVAA